MGGKMRSLDEQGHQGQPDGHQKNPKDVEDRERALQRGNPIRPGEGRELTEDVEENPGACPPLSDFAAERFSHEIPLERGVRVQNHTGSASVASLAT